jgi:hypothetical protein
MKIIYITSQKANTLSDGGILCSYGRISAVYNYFGEENVEVFNLYDSKRSKILKRINLLFFRWFELDKNNENIILSKIADKDVVCIEYSYYGRIAKLVKELYPNVKIILLFQNVERDYIKQQNPYNLVYQKIAQINEIWACKYSDVIISLNFRDAKRIYELYGRKPNAIIPVSFSNRDITFSEEKIGIPSTALFLGSNFFANIHGIKWFIKNVLPFVNIKLKIVGKDMDRANLPENEKMEVFGYIENLDECMQKADLIVLPIFKGSGMKVKTCEVLMHGKNIIGTGEAFQGYDIDFEKVGARCETAKEFIEAINGFPKRFTHKFNEYSRNAFLEKYNNDVTFRQFAEVFEKCL